MRGKLINILYLSSILICFSLLISNSELCGGSGCRIVHDTPFSNFLGIPIPVYGMSILALSWVIRKKREDISNTILASLFGADLYLLWLQLFFIKALCILCILFTISLFFLFLATVKPFRLNLLMVSILAFFAFHFMMIPPIGGEACDSIYSLPMSSKIKIKVFASGSCRYCISALEYLRNICDQNGYSLVVYPVDEKFYFNEMKTKPSPFEKVVLSKIVWENKKKLMSIAQEPVVPFIIVEKNNGGKVKKAEFKGWDDNVKMAINLFCNGYPENIDSLFNNDKKVMGCSEKDHTCD